MTIYHLEKMAGSPLENLDRDLKTKAYVTALNIVTGERPIVNEYDQYTNIDLTPQQVEFFKGRLDKWAAAKPGDVRINVKPVIVPWAVKKYWPVAAGAVVLGVVIGKFI